MDNCLMDNDKAPMAKYYLLHYPLSIINYPFWSWNPHLKFKSDVESLHPLPNLPCADYLLLFRVQLSC